MLAERPGSRAVAGTPETMISLAARWRVSDHLERSRRSADSAAQHLAQGAQGALVAAFHRELREVALRGPAIQAIMTAVSTELSRYAQGASDVQRRAKALRNQNEDMLRARAVREDIPSFGTEASPTAVVDTENAAERRFDGALAACDEERELLDRLTATTLEELSAQLAANGRTQLTTASAARDGGTTVTPDLTERFASALAAWCPGQAPVQLRVVPESAPQPVGMGLAVTTLRILEFGRAVIDAGVAFGTAALPAATLTVQSAFVTAARAAAPVRGIPEQALAFALVATDGIRRGRHSAALGTFALLELRIGALHRSQRYSRTVQGLISGGRLLGGFSEPRLIGREQIERSRVPSEYGLPELGRAAATERRDVFREQTDTWTSASAGAAAGGPISTVSDVFVRAGDLDAVGGKEYAAVDVIRHAGEPPRLTAILPSTQQWSPWSSSAPNDLYGNLLSVQGRQSELERFAEEAIRVELVAFPEAERDRVEIQLAGFSQGGLAAAALATRGTLNVTRVITAGSPIGALAHDLPEGVRVLAYEAPDDPVPRLDGRANPDGPAVITVTGEVSARQSGPDTPPGSHSALRYAMLAAHTASDEAEASIVADTFNGTQISNRYFARWER